MATHAPTTGAPTRAPFIPAPPAAVTRVLATFNRDQLSGFIAVAIDLLDLDDGDNDLETNGDELDGNASEDDFMAHSHSFAGPGCPIADAGEDDDNDHEHDGREPDHEGL